MTKTTKATATTGLMAQVAAFEVPQRSFALWYLGQNGWILKSPSGFTVAIDPYLSDFCRGRRPNMDTARQLPVFVAPEALAVELLACTHSHVDHACPVTISGALKAGTRQFMGPAETQLTFDSCGVPADRRIVTYPNHRIAFDDLAFIGVFALPTDHTDLTHMGFVIEVDGGPRLYITGDTAETDLLQTAGRHKPQVMCVCINAGFKNLSHWQAAELVKAIDPEIAIPCHFDMFRDNSCPPHMFRASLAVLGIEEKYRLLDYAKPFVYPADSGSRA